MDSGKSGSNLQPKAYSLSGTFLQALGADQMHRWGLDGTGVAVAVVDSGIADLPGLRVLARVDFTGEEGDGFDPYGHGTHVAGILGFHALGPTAYSLQPTASLQGLAPGVDLVDVRVIDSEGKGRTSTLIQALDWIGQNAGRLGIRVVNLSLGHPPFEGGQGQLVSRKDPIFQPIQRRFPRCDRRSGVHVQGFFFAWLSRPLAGFHSVKRPRRIPFQPIQPP